MTPCARLCLWSAVIFLSAVLSAPAAAGEDERGKEGAEKPRVLRPGDVVPDFEVRDLEGRAHRLSSYRARKAIVLAFNGIGCPIAEQYAPRLVALHKRFAPEGAVFFGINSNRQDTVEELRAFAHRFGIEYPILKDHGAKVADLLGVERTTEVFVLDGTLRLRYRGAVDDQYAISALSVGIRKERAEKHYLVAALEAVLSGKEPEIRETRADGCIIGRERRAQPDASLTYHRDIEPIIQRRCQECHRPGQIAPFSLLEYDDVAGWAGMIAEVVENRRMPPWHADPRYGRFANDRSLTAEERRAILAWVEAGAPRGDPKDAPPRPSFPENWRIGEPDVVFEMPRAYRVPATGTVPYQYFIVRTDFKEDRWVQAMEIQAGSRDVVHHILVFAVDPERPRLWRRETGGGIRGYFAAMVPGEEPQIFPEGTAKRLPAGATLVFQVHYTPNGTPRTDRSRIGMIFARKPVKREVHTRSVHALWELVIPPGAEDHEVRAYYRFRRPARLLSFLPHMHLRGKSFTYVAHYPASVRVSRSPWKAPYPPEIAKRLDFDGGTNTLIWCGELDGKAYEALAKVYTSEEDRRALEELRRKGRSEILLHVPRYDFGWQETYRLLEPKRMPQGTVLEGIAVYDNSPSNPALTKDMWSKTVRWGEQTWDEMMIGYFDWVEDEREGATAAPGG